MRMWKQKLWWLPHAISGIRAFGGASLLVMNPITAFWSSLAFMSTDFFDGWAARWVGNESDFGKIWADPVADFLFGFWALLRWVLLMPSRFRISSFVAILVFGFVGKILKQQRTLLKIHHFFYGILPLYYLSLSWLFMYLYGADAYPSRKALLGFIALVSIPCFAYAKPHRLQEWLSHITLAFAKTKAPVAE